MTTVTARTPTDLAAIVPQVIGFYPTESLVMLTFNARTQFHARVDLPITPEVTGLLLEPARRHGVKQVCFLTYSDASVNPASLGLLVAAFQAAGIEVVDTVALPNLPDPTLVDNPLVTQATVDGHVAQASREALAEQIAPASNAFSVEEVADGATDDARTIRDLASIPTRDAELDRIATSEDKRVNLERMLRLARLAPKGEHRGNLLTMAGFAAWQAGHGALAWICVDAARVEGSKPLTELVATVLTKAVEPHAYRDLIQS